jgi:hypothetical protein
MAPLVGLDGLQAAVACCIRNSGRALFRMAITIENHPKNDVFEVKFWNSETGTEAITRVTAASVSEAGPLAKTKIRSLPGAPEHVLWVIPNCDDLVVERIKRRESQRHRQSA